MTTGATGASGTLVNGTIGAPGRGRRSRSVSKVGIKLGAYKKVTVASTLCVDCFIILHSASITFFLFKIGNVLVLTLLCGFGAWFFMKKFKGLFSQ